MKHLRFRHGITKHMTIKAKLKLRQLYTVFTVLLTLLLILPETTNAQSRTRYKRGKSSFEKLVTNNWQASVMVGPTMYYGDLSKYDSDPLKKMWNESGPGIQLVLGNKLTSYMAFQGRLSYLGFGATSEELNRRTNGRVITLGANILIDFVNLLSLPYETYSDIYLYGLIGGGLVHIRSKLENATTGEQIVEYEWQDTPSNESTFYFGFGLNKYLTSRFDITLEFLVYKLQTDRIDAFFGGENNDLLVMPSIGIKYNLSELLPDKRLYQNQRNKRIRR